ncbi:MAG TPA: peptidoglycan DD-metalloendopeptidase family protein [Pseudomonadales bacterium]|nr:peptidoglycan DD-metalloendopeptidase family protein [Pseudomonadales bacterium]
MTAAPATRRSPQLLASSLPYLASALLAFTLAGCQPSSHRASIDQLGQPPDYKLHTHTVTKGDTLIAIAWRYGMDYHQLANMNNLSPPYKILVGQKLKIDNNSPVDSSSTSRSSATQAIAIPADEGVHEIRTERGSSGRVTMPTNSTTGTAQTRTVTEHQARPAENAAAIPASEKHWVWPARGAVIARFSPDDALRKGIDLDGKAGDPVIAAAAGNVVYAGSGLAGYGQLLIVKHNEKFLSAYAHNSKLLVKEGDAVKSGQKIAEIGASGTDRNKLHFEIRRDGKPVDPLLYLPAR